MKHRVRLNHYPDNYVEEELPQVLVEIRYRNHDDFDHNAAVALANEIETFLNKGRPAS